MIRSTHELSQLLKGCAFVQVKALLTYKQDLQFQAVQGLLDCFSVYKPSLLRK